jgi:hypothetical protein
MPAFAESFGGVLAAVLLGPAFKSKRACKSNRRLQQRIEAQEDRAGCYA